MKRVSESAGRKVLDASALLAVILREPGADAVAAVLEGAIVNAVNLTETLIVLSRRGVDPLEATALLDTLPLIVVTSDLALAPVIADIHRLSRTQGLSLGDCVCLGTARVAGAVAYTADRRWKGAKVGVEIKLIRS